MTRDGCNLTAEQLYRQLVERDGMSEQAAAWVVDVGIAERAVARRLRRQGIQRQPTATEIARELARF